VPGLVRRLALVLAAAAAVALSLAASGLAAGAASQDFCGQADGLVCSQVVVPLDRTGAVPGTVTLHVEMLPAGGVARGTIFLIAGGPGQGSAHVFGLGSPRADQLFRYLFPGYDLVAYDDRGTGASGLIDCPDLQSALTEAANQAAIATCGASLGAAANFYSTATHAEDLEAVRQSLGLDKVALYGVSYGTKLALAYALAHPDHVARLALTSVLPPELPDPYEANVLRQLPATLRTLCAAGCNGTTLVSDLVTVANRLGAKPVTGNAISPAGRTVQKTVGGTDLLSIVLSADLNPGEAAELPGVLHAARGGDYQPLLRLAVLNDLSNLDPAIDLSAGLNAATVCHDGQFPWQAATPPDQRLAALEAAASALPAGTLGPFGPWAGRFGSADFCLRWPGSTGDAPLGAGPLPDVPMLAISGGFDMRTPTADARSVVARFPHGQLLVVPGVGHDAVDADLSGCAAAQVHAWMLDQAVAQTCPRVKPDVMPVPTLPAPGRARPRTVLSPRATLGVVHQTIADALALAELGLPGSVPGLYGGKVTVSLGKVALASFSDSRGVTVSGTLRLKAVGPPLLFQGAVTVNGAAAARGVLGLTGASLRGTLGGRPVG
jgi:pimeloyl-ACP methyl ester carboxylesterase